MATSNAEDYLKVLYYLSEERSEVASTGEVARRLGLTPGSVTGMLQRMQRQGLVEYAPHQGARLTATGAEAALRVLRRHRLLELFLVDALGMSWDEVHVEAELLEHSASDRLIDRIAEHLDHPKHDPHGAPIPDARGNVEVIEGRSLADCPAGVAFQLRQVDDSSRELLRYLRQVGLGLDARGLVVRNEPAAGIVEIDVDGRRHVFSHDAAKRLRVAEQSEPT